MKKYLSLFSTLIVLIAATFVPQQSTALGFLNPSFEDTTEGNFWECTGCTDIANYVVQNSGAFDGVRFAVVLNEVSLFQRVSVPTKGDTTRLVFWYRNTGNTKVKIKRRGRTLQSIPLERSRSEWRKMKVDNIPQGKRVHVIIENNGDGYTFFDDFRFRKINRLRVTVNVDQDGIPIEGARVQVLSRNRGQVTSIYNTQNVEKTSVVSDEFGVAHFRIDPSNTRRYIIRVSKDGVNTDIPLNRPTANSRKTVNATLEGLVLPETDEEI